MAKGVHLARTVVPTLAYRVQPRGTKHANIGSQVQSPTYPPMSELAAQYIPDEPLRHLGCLDTFLLPLPAKILSMPSTVRARTDAGRALRRSKWPRPRRAAYAWLQGLELRFSDGSFTKADFKKWTYAVAALSPTALSLVAREPAVLESFSVPTDFECDEVWPKIYLKNRAKAPVLSALLLLGMFSTPFSKWPSN